MIRNALFLAIVVLSSTAGEIAVSHAMKRIGEVHNFSPRAILGVVRRAFRQARPLWSALAAERSLRLCVGPGGHRFYADLAWREIAEIWRL